jgi:hypothetical protein
MGGPGEGEPWIQRAERTVRAEAGPAEAVVIYRVCWLLEPTLGRDRDALVGAGADGWSGCG